MTAGRAEFWGQPGNGWRGSGTQPEGGVHMMSQCRRAPAKCGDRRIQRSNKAPSVNGGAVVADSAHRGTLRPLARTCTSQPSTCPWQPADRRRSFPIFRSEDAAPKHCCCRIDVWRVTPCCHAARAHGSRRGASQSYTSGTVPGTGNLKLGQGPPCLLGPRVGHLYQTTFIQPTSSCIRKWQCDTV